MESSWGDEEDLPAEARELIEATEREIEKLRKKTERDIARLRQKLEGEIQAVQQKADEAAQGQYQQLAERLKPLQVACAREGLLDEALAIRARLRSLRGGVSGVQPGPEVLTCRPQDVGRSFLYEITGSTDGELWGTDVYTSDSSLPAAAVHAGLLKPGERGVVRVTILDTSDREEFPGSRRHGVSSEFWDSWELGFRVSRP
jgi:hypothetical protein